MADEKEKFVCRVCKHTSYSEVKVSHVITGEPSQSRTFTIYECDGCSNIFRYPKKFTEPKKD